MFIGKSGVCYYYSSRIFELILDKVVVKYLGIKLLQLLHPVIPGRKQEASPAALLDADPPQPKSLKLKESLLYLVSKQSASYWVNIIIIDSVRF